MDNPSWSINVGDWAEGSMAKAAIAAQKIAGELFRRVILRTPVKTGRAIGNWQATIGTPSALTLDGTDGSDTAILRAIETVRGWRLGSAAIFLTNNLPYIERLENGWSKQAPNGMVALTVAEFGGIATDAAGGYTDSRFAGEWGGSGATSGWNIGEAGE